MAKRKTKPKSRKKEVEQEYERSAFWPVAGAILMFLAAIFILIGGFGLGGPLPEGMFQIGYSLLGWSAYLIPVALGYFGLAKIMTADNRVPLPATLSMFAFIVMVTCWIQTGFGKYDAVTQTWSNSPGGMVGEFFGSLALNALDKLPAAIMFFVFSLLLFFLTFGISPKVLLAPFGLLGKKEEDTDLAALKRKETGFKLNEGVPVEHHEAGAAQRTSLKNTAQKLSSNENHAALTAASDPDWKYPSVDLLNQKQDKADPGNVEANADTIKETLAHFNIAVEMEGANVGPRVTQYTLKPPAGVKLNKITALDSNIALDLGANSIRVEAPIPGKKAVGVEVPNAKAATVRISSVLGSNEWASQATPLSIAIGKDIAGQPIMGDLSKMPHLLVAGQTGSGKSVMINTLLTSLLYRNSPSDLKLILVDPKQVEMAPYEDIPHLLTPVITEPEKCISALKWAVAEMERRYRTLREHRKRSITDYNAVMKDQSMPYIVIVIDELADLMMMAARDVESLIVRIAQKARAVGIHLVVATQRPSVDVITGLIKANVPGRIAFTTQSQVDSRTIIDRVGAEKLLGMGDMLFLTSDMPAPKRVQGAFIGDDETASVMDFLRMQRPPQYDDEVVSQPVQLNGKGGIVADYTAGDDADEPIYRDAVAVVIEGRKASTSLLQRRLRIGYGKAARLMETMEEQGIIGHADGNRPREVLVNSLDEVFGGGASEADEALDENFPEDEQKI